MKQYCKHFKKEITKEECYKNKENFTICKQGIAYAFFRFCCFLEKNQMDRTKPYKG